MLLKPQTSNLKTQTSNLIVYLKDLIKIMFVNSWWQSLVKFSLVIICTLTVLFINPSSVNADIDNDRYDGNIFVVYAGNGSLVPPRLTLTQSLQRKTPTILVYYLDDSSDCKQFAFVVSRMQEFYGRVASIIPVNVDTIAPKDNYTTEETGYYYEGVVPQTVILNEEAEVIFNGKGQVQFEEVDDILRNLFDLLPRSESVTLKKRSFNQFNSELVAE